MAEPPQADPPSRWNFGDARQHLLANAEAQLSSQVRGMWAGFLGFALRDNVLEVAVGLMVATQFTAVTNSLVSDLVLPLLSLLPFISKNLEEKFLVLQNGPQGYFEYNTRKQALEDGAIIWPYGQFLDKLFNFVCVGFSLYLVATMYGYFSQDSESIIKPTKRCTYCRKEISEKAMRCPVCTSWLDGREDPKASALPHHTS